MVHLRLAYFNVCNLYSIKNKYFDWFLTNNPQIINFMIYKIKKFIKSIFYNTIIYDKKYTFDLCPCFWFLA